jgi:phage shock protein C
MKKLYRKTASKKIAGVCAGLGEYFNIDPTLIRIVFLVVSLFWGFGIVFYLICWAAMPTESQIR